MAMILNLYFLLTIALPMPVVAQDKFTIRYETKWAIKDTLRNAGGLAQATLVINDSLSCTYYPGISAEQSNWFPLGNSYLPKSSFINLITCVTLFPSVLPGYPKRLVEDGCRKGNWEIYEMMTKEVLGYKCIRATGVINGTSIVAWYAPALPAGFAPHFSPDLPGTVLEYWYEKTPYITTAIEIKKEAVDIVEPDFWKRISREDYDKMMRKRRAYPNTTNPKGITVRVL
ncbi:MAG: GLPGLI family protein [Ferruginibacter sp.]|nr:GLPGLI family protein [Chitinophagaceae bacterium]